MKFQKNLKPKSNMQIVIQNIGGRWLCNGKTYQDLTFSEKQFFDEFLTATRLENLVKS